MAMRDDRSITSYATIEEDAVVYRAMGDEGETPEAAEVRFLGEAGGAILQAVKATYAVEKPYRRDPWLDSCMASWLTVIQTGVHRKGGDAVHGAAKVCRQGGHGRGWQGAVCVPGPELQMTEVVLGPALRGRTLSVCDPHEVTAEQFVVVWSDAMSRDR